MAQATKPLGPDEIRTCSDIELRRAADKTTLVGYAAMFGSLSEDLGGFREFIAPGAFSSSLASGGDIYALADHDASKRLGRTKNQSLRLHEDGQGLRFELDLPKTALGNQTAEEVRTGLADAMSFGFNVIKDDWREDKTGVTRELIDIDLREVSVVSFPAYRETVIGTAKRSLERHLKPEGPTIREIERTLRDLGLSRTAAKRTAALAYENQRDADDTAIITLLTRRNKDMRQFLKRQQNGNLKETG